MTDFITGGVPNPDYDSDDINYVNKKTEFTDDVFVYGKLYADLGGDVQTFSTAGVERMRITKEGDVIFTSNLSIAGVVTAINFSGNLNTSGISTFKDDVEFHGTNGISSITFDKSQNSLKFLDESKAIFGTGDDLQIYHTNELKDQTDSNGDSVCDNRTSLIKEKGSGGLIFKTDGGDGPGAFQFFDQGWRPMLKMHGGNNARTVLYHDGDERLVTTSSGVTVTGTVAATNANITGNLTVAAQPCVQLYTVSNVSSFGTSTEATPLQFSDVHINQGGMTLSNSNSRVQVPVSGIYLVNAMVSGGNYSTVSSGDGVRLQVMRNGSSYPGIKAYGLNTLGSATNMEFLWSFSILLNLTATDYLELEFENIQTDFGGAITRGQFGIHLLS